MNLFATELLIEDRVRELRAAGPDPIGTTRIAAMVKRYEDELASLEPRPVTTGPVERRREAA